MSDTNTDITIKFKAAMTLADADKLHQEVLKSLEGNPKKVILDFAENEEIDFSTMQILVAYITQLKSRNIKVSWDNPSIALFERSVELGMDDALGI